MTSHNLLSDQQLLDLIQEDDRAAFTVIYNRYWEKMLLIAWNHTKDKFLAEDIVHEVFMALWKEKNNFRIVNVGGFLSTKVKFVIFKHYRKQHRRERLAGMNLNFSELSMDEEKLDALFLKEYINGVVEHLPEKCKLVFRYSREAGMKNAEIAEQMNISEKGVEAHLTRALKVIRHSLEASGLLLIISCEISKYYK